MHPSVLEIRANMLDLLSYLGKLGNIDDDVSSLRGMVDNIVTKRKKLKTILTEDEFKNSSKYFDTIIKQIEKKIDNLIGRKTIEQKGIAGELKLMNNKKKLSKYRR
ncbi:MAG: hypothetical protein PF445_04725 [Melioribacteraceae bacterium]|jgi:hypothetical protein|nr:hypothetical protein [Melioribacteraceae bacterium]